MYQDWNTHHDWSVKNAIVDLLVRLKENIKGISGNLLSPLWGNKTIGPASQMLLTGVRLQVHLRRRLHHIQRWHRNMVAVTSGYNWHCWKSSMLLLVRNIYLVGGGGGGGGMFLPPLVCKNLVTFWSCTFDFSNIPLKLLRLNIEQFIEVKLYICLYTDLQHCQRLS